MSGRREAPVGSDDGLVPQARKQASRVWAYLPKPRSCGQTGSGVPGRMAFTLVRARQA
jgi:hypothetical protein